MWLWTHTGNTRGNLVRLEEIFLHTKKKSLPASSLSTVHSTWDSTHFPPIETS